MQLAMGVWMEMMFKMKMKDVVMIRVVVIWFDQCFLLNPFHVDVHIRLLLSVVVSFNESMYDTVLDSSISTTPFTSASNSSVTRACSSTRDYGYDISTCFRQNQRNSHAAWRSTQRAWPSDIGIFDAKLLGGCSAPDVEKCRAPSNPRLVW